MIIMICHKTYKQKQINKNTELNIISLLPSLFNLIFQTSFFNSTYYFDDLIKSNKYIQYLFLKNSIFRIFVGTCLSLCHVMNNCTFTSWKFSIFDWRFIFNNNVFFLPSINSTTGSDGRSKTPSFQKMFTRQNNQKQLPRGVLKVGPSPSKKNCFTCFDASSLKW